MNFKIPYRAIFKSYDGLGIASSTLCAIHCMITPFICTALSCKSSGCSNAPMWYGAFDILFILLSCTAAYFATKHTSVRWIKIAFYMTIALQIFTILNEDSAFIKSFPYFSYIIFSILISLHVINFFLSCYSNKENCISCTNYYE